MFSADLTTASHHQQVASAPLQPRADDSTSNAIEQHQNHLDTFSYPISQLDGSVVDINPLHMNLELDDSFWLPAGDLSQTLLSFAPLGISPVNNDLGGTLFPQDQLHEARDVQQASNKKSSEAIRMLVRDRWHTTQGPENPDQPPPSESREQDPGCIDENYQSILSHCLRIAPCDTSLPSPDFLVSAFGSMPAVDTLTSTELVRSYVFHEVPSGLPDRPCSIVQSDLRKLLFVSVDLFDRSAFYWRSQRQNPRSSNVPEDKQGNTLFGRSCSHLRFR